MVILSIQELIFYEMPDLFFFALLCDLCGKVCFTGTFHISYPVQLPQAFKSQVDTSFFKLLAGQQWGKIL